MLALMLPRNFLMAGIQPASRWGKEILVFARMEKETPAWSWVRLSAILRKVLSLESDRICFRSCKVPAIPCSWYRCRSPMPRNRRGPKTTAFGVFELYPRFERLVAFIFVWTWVSCFFVV